MSENVIDFVKKPEGKKVLKVKKGEYLLEIRNNSIATTYNIDSAMDVNTLNYKDLAYLVTNLKKVGYVYAVIVKVEEEKQPLEKLPLEEKTEDKDNG